MKEKKAAHAAKGKRWGVQQEGKTSPNLSPLTIAIRQMEYITEMVQNISSVHSINST